MRVSFDAGRTDEFIVAACVPRDDHASGTLEAADAIRRAHPRVAADDIYGAAVLGDHAEVERLPSVGFVRAARALLDAGADPTLRAPARKDRSAVAVAARSGRADALELFASRGFAARLDRDDAFFAALACGDKSGTLRFVTTEPRIAERLEASQPRIVATLAGAGNTAALELALDLGFPMSADALAVAVWHERTEAVRLLLDRGAPVSATEFSLARRALTEMSEWTPHHPRDILDALQARASEP